MLNFYSKFLIYVIKYKRKENLFDILITEINNILNLSKNIKQNKSSSFYS